MKEVAIDSYFIDYCIRNVFNSFKHLFSIYEYDYLIFSLRSIIIINLIFALPQSSLWQFYDPLLSEFGLCLKYRTLFL